MLKMDERVKIQVDAVRARCLELDKEFEGAELSRKFSEALEYVEKYRDPELKGRSHNHLTPLDRWWDGKEELTPAHFNFWVSVRKPGSDKQAFGMAMHYHTGRPQIGDSIEVESRPYPHWSFHS